MPLLTATLTINRPDEWGDFRVVIDHNLGTFEGSGRTPAQGFSKAMKALVAGVGTSAFEPRPPAPAVPWWG